MPPSAFYEPLGGGRYLATEHTVGPWDPRSQHAGPPSALLARAIEREPASWPATIARMSVDILGPIPVGELAVRSRVLRPGRSVELVEAELEAGERTVLRAQAWRIRETQLELPALPAVLDPDGQASVPPLPAEESPPRPGWVGGYLRSIEWRAVGRHWADPGPAVVWTRMRHPLLPGEEPSGLQRVMAVADSGNGVSSVLPIETWLFINTELTVHLATVPAGEWICLDARTSVDPRGFGLATSKLFDQERLVGVGAQTLCVRPR